MPQSENFRDFCTQMIERLGGAFPDMRFYKAGAIEELVNWLEAKASGSEERAAQLVTIAGEMEEIPSIADLNRLWTRLYITPNAKPIASPDCLHCAGTGWEEREGTIKSGMFAGETRTFVTRCRCGGMPPGAKADEAWETTGARA